MVQILASFLGQRSLAVCVHLAETTVGTLFKQGQ